MQGRLGDELIDFEFVFDNDFKLEEFTDGELSIYNETEERILEIINQISTFISVIDMNPGKQHGRSDRVISKLMTQFEALMDSPLVTDAFKQSQVVTDFLEKYQQYLGK